MRTHPALREAPEIGAAFTYVLRLDRYEDVTAGDSGSDADSDAGAAPSRPARASDSAARASDSAGTRPLSDGPGQAHSDRGDSKRTTGVGAPPVGASGGAASTPSAHTPGGGPAKRRLGETGVGARPSGGKHKGASGAAAPPGAALAAARAGVPARPRCTALCATRLQRRPRCCPFICSRPGMCGRRRKPRSA